VNERRVANFQLQISTRGLEVEELLCATNPLKIVGCFSSFPLTRRLLVARKNPYKARTAAEEDVHFGNNNVMKFWKMKERRPPNQQWSNLLVYPAESLEAPP